MITIKWRDCELIKHQGTQISPTLVLYLKPTNLHSMVADVVVSVVVSVVVVVVVMVRYMKGSLRHYLKMECRCFAVFMFPYFMWLMSQVSHTTSNKIEHSPRHTHKAIQISGVNSLSRSAEWIKF